LQTALAEEPSLILEFYSYGVLLKKREGSSLSEYAVDPAQVATALAAKVSFDSGLLIGDTLLIRTSGVRQTVVEFRKSQKTGLFLEGSDAPLRVPLLPLLLIRSTTDNRNPQYQLFAAKKRPASLDTELYNAPLPNIFSDGGICWGTVHTISDEALAGCSLAADWGILLGSPFGDHACANKSKSHRSDIRQQLIELEQRKVRVYPKSDLISTGRTLAQVIGDPS